MTPQKLLEAAQTVADRLPAAELRKNSVGNLSVIQDGVYVGFVDLITGEVEIWDEPQADDARETP